MCPVDLDKTNTGGYISGSFNAFAVPNSSSLNDPNFIGQSFQSFLFSGDTSRAMFETNRQNTFHRPKKDQSSVMLDGSWSLYIASIV